MQNHHVTADLMRRRAWKRMEWDISMSMESVVRTDMGHLVVGEHYEINETNAKNCNLDLDFIA